VFFITFQKVYDFIKNYEEYVVVDSKRKPYTASYVLDEKIVLNKNKGQQLKVKNLLALKVNDDILQSKFTLKHYDTKGIIVDVNSEMIILVKEGDDFE
jgi:hypothetical protein